MYYSNLLDVSYVTGVSYVTVALAQYDSLTVYIPIYLLG